MVLAKYLNPGEIKFNDKFFLINIIFGFFPISFILGSLIVNINLVLFCLIGAIYLKSQIFKIKLNLTIKIIFIFFFFIFLSTFLSFIRSTYFEGYEYENLARLIKSLLFLRFFFMLVIVYLLTSLNVLKFKYFFLVAAFSSILISLDIIFQHLTSFNIMGIESSGIHNSSFFGDEPIAGSFIQRFAFFAIFFSSLLFEKKRYGRFIFIFLTITALGLGILFSGNRMPLILFLFGLFLIFFTKIKIKKILLVSLISFIIILKFILSSSEEYKSMYLSYYMQAKNIIAVAPNIDYQLMPRLRNPFALSTESKKNLSENKTTVKKQISYDVKYQSGHRRLFLAAVDTWKDNKIFGNGIKSFRIDCLELDKKDINIEEDMMPGKKNRLCSNHPHNYYLEVLTETGLVGLFFILLIGLFFLIFIFKNIKFIKTGNLENLVLISSSISLILETLPFKSTGSLFTSNNATYIIIIASIILSYKRNYKN